MSVIVKGMKMPKSCYDCDFTFSKGTEHGNFTDPLSGKVFHERERIGCLLCEMDITLVESIEGGRYRDCPLIEVPPHGRLIDADALRLLYDFNGYEPTGDMTEEEFDRLMCRLPVIRANIDDAPTIIERET